MKASRRDFIKQATSSMALAGFSRRAFAAQSIKKRNILLIITDQQFADAMSCRMGHEFIYTPAMDRLARTGTQFTRAYSSNPICVPWRNAAFTGRYPHQTGITRNTNDPNPFVCMGTYFRNAGYETVYTGKWHLNYDSADIQSHGFRLLTEIRARGSDERVADAAESFFAGSHTKPFLFVAAFTNPHNICNWARLLAGKEDSLSQGTIGDAGEIGRGDLLRRLPEIIPSLQKLPPVPDNFAPQKDEPDGMAHMRYAYQIDLGPDVHQPFPVNKFTEEDWRKHRWGYYRFIEKVDAEIDRVLNALHKAGLEDDTLVIFTSDHGEMAGAHAWNQKTVFYDESTRVPFIVSCKGKTGGKLMNQLVNTGVDLLPTMIEYAGFEIPEEFPGKSVIPLAFGEAVDHWRDYLVVQNDMGQTRWIDGRRAEMQGRMVRTVRYKYCIYSRGKQRESLVDMDADPGEMVNLAADPDCREIILQHRELLAQFGREQNDGLIDALLANGVGPVPFF